MSVTKRDRLASSPAGGSSFRAEGQRFWDAVGGVNCWILQGRGLYTEREKLPDAHHPNDSVSESISPYELVACGPISHPNISTRAAPWPNTFVHHAFPPRTPSRPVFLYPRSCTHAACVHEGEPPWRWRENSHRARFASPRRNKNRPSRKQVTAEHRRVNYQLLLFLLPLSVHLITPRCVPNGRSADERTPEGRHAKRDASDGKIRVPGKRYP